MRRRFHTQIDLFTISRRLPGMTGAERQKAVELLRALLKEAATKPVRKPPITGQKEAGNE
jgi:hypothetical protein